MCVCVAEFQNHLLPKEKHLVYLCAPIYTEFKELTSQTCVKCRLNGFISITRGASAGGNAKRKTIKKTISFIMVTIPFTT